MMPKKTLRVDFLPRSAFKGYPDSYTLFGAICWGIRVLEGEEALTDMLEKFKEKPPFLISSPVFIRKGKLFFPRPALEENSEEELTPESYSLRKKVKKAKYVSEDAFRAVLEGKVRTSGELSKFTEEGEFYSSLNTIHASINRITWTTSGGELYNEEVYYLSLPFSVFFLFYQEEFEALVKSALRFVQLGGNRSTGMGRYKVIFGDVPEWFIKHLEPTENFISLSPHFYDDSFVLEESLYEPKPLMGIVDNYFYAPTPAIIKRKVMYIDRGSNIRVKNRKDFYGGLKEVVRDEGRNVTVYQYGYAFPLYVRWQ